LALNQYIQTTVVAPLTASFADFYLASLNSFPGLQKCYEGRPFLLVEANGCCRFLLRVPPILVSVKILV